MADYPLIVFGTANARVPLTVVRDVLVTEGYPAGFGMAVAGEATDEEMSDPRWEIAFLRWPAPEVHEVALIEVLSREEDEEEDHLISQHLARIARLRDAAGRMIVAEHLNRTRILYTVQVLPALLADDDHAAWAALDVLLRFLSQTSDGIIYAEAEGYCDTDGELLLAETDDLNPADSDVGQFAGY